MTDVTEEEPKRDWARTAVWGLVAGYFVLAMFVAAAFRSQAEEAEDRAESDRRIVVSQTLVSCRDRNATKDAVRGLIDQAIAEGSNGGNLDFAEIEGFEDLEAQDRAYWLNVGEVLNSAPSGSSITDRLQAYRDGLIDEDCKALAATLERQLREEDAS